MHRLAACPAPKTPSHPLPWRARTRSQAQGGACLARRGCSARLRPEIIPSFEGTPGARRLALNLGSELQGHGCSHRIGSHAPDIMMLMTGRRYRQGGQHRHPYSSPGIECDASRARVAPVPSPSEGPKATAGRHLLAGPGAERNAVGAGYRPQGPKREIFSSYA
jgi:hypothetical protein